MAEEVQEKKDVMRPLKEWYEKNTNRMLVLPAVVVAIAIIIIVNFAVTNEDIMEKDVTLKGGLTATILTEKPVDIAALQERFIQIFGDAAVRRIDEFGTDRQVGIIAEVSTENEPAVKEVLAQELNIGITEENYSVEVIGSTLSNQFYKQMLTAIILAFIFMAVVVFIVFRTFIPSAAVVLAALFDIIVTLAVVDLLHIRVSTTGISAFLLLIGYSIDTDILLTTRVLRRKTGTLMERVFGAMKTGMTMTTTTIVALIAGLLISESAAIEQMFIIIVIGLLTDVIMTYAMNAPIIIHYARKKGMQ